MTIVTKEKLDRVMKQYRKASSVDVISLNISAWPVLNRVAWFTLRQCRQRCLGGQIHSL